MPNGTRKKPAVNKTEGAASLSNLPVRVEVEQIDKRVTNVEKITETVGALLSAAITSANDYLKKKNEIEERQLELEHIQHKRGVYLLAFAIGVLFVLIMTAMLLAHAELVSSLVTSSLALAAGAGLMSFIKPSRKAGKQGDS